MEVVDGFTVPSVRGMVLRGKGERLSGGGGGDIYSVSGLYFFVIQGMLLRDRGCMGVCGLPLLRLICVYFGVFILYFRQLL